MLIIELMIELAIELYISLGLGTKEYKIEKKIERLSKEYPEVLEHYHSNKSQFYTDEQLSEMMLRLSMKNELEKEKAALYINQRFTLTCIS